MYKTDKNGTPEKLTAVKALLAGWLAAVFMIYTAIPHTVFAYAVVALFLFCTFRLNKNGFALTLTLTLIAYLAMASVTALAQVLGLISAAVIGGVMLTEKRSAVIFAVFAAAVYGVAAVLHSPVEALSVLTAVPVAAALAVCAKLRARRVSAICVVSAVFAITVIAPVAVSFYAEHGGEWLEQFKLLLDETRTAIVDALVKTAEELPAETKEMLPDVFTADTVRDAVDLIFPLIPAIFIIASNIFAFVAHTLSLWARFGLGELPETDETVFEMSKVSAWLYIISFCSLLFNFSSSPTAEICAIALQSLNLILTPSFLFAGIVSVTTAFRVAGGKKKWFHGVLAVLAIMYCSAFLVYPLVAFGVIGTIRSGRVPHDRDGDIS